MKLTNSEVIQAQGALARLMEMKLPVKVSLDIALISNTVDRQVKAFVAVRDRLYKDYSIITGQGDAPGSVKFTCSDKEKEEENLRSFQVEFNELLEAKTDDLIFKRIQLPSEVSGEPLQIEPSILVALTEFVEVV